MLNHKDTKAKQSMTWVYHNLAKMTFRTTLCKKSGALSSSVAKSFVT